LIGDDINVGIAFPAKIVFVFWAEVDMEDVMTVYVLAADQMESVIALALRCQRKQVRG
jgi:hypothetical protein